MYSACRPAEDGKTYWRFAHFGFPFWTWVPQGEITDRVQALAVHVRDEYGGDAERVWAQAQDAGNQTVVFTDTTPLAGNAELARRLLTPLTVLEMQKALTRAGQHLRDQSLTLADEKFLVHIRHAI